VYRSWVSFVREHSSTDRVDNIIVVRNQAEVVYLAIKILLCVALESELPKEEVPRGVQVLYTGVGKINASIALS